MISAVFVSIGEGGWEGDEKEIFGPSEERGGGSPAKSCTRIPPPPPSFPVSRGRGKKRSKTKGRLTFPYFFVFCF